MRVLRTRLLTATVLPAAASAGASAAVGASSSTERLVLHQLQRMFFALQSSKRAYYDPLPFCRVFKNSAGESVDVKIQMDAQQYLLGLIEKLEEGLGGTTDPLVLQDTMRGSIVQQLMCQGGCKSVRERPESFYSVPLEVWAERLPALPTLFHYRITC